MDGTKPSAPPLGGGAGATGYADPTPPYSDPPPPYQDLGYPAPAVSGAVGGPAVAPSASANQPTVGQF